MNIKTIEERLKIKADKIGSDRASKLLDIHSELRAELISMEERLSDIISYD